MAPPGNQAANGEDEAQPEHQEKPAYSPTPDPKPVDEIYREWLEKDRPGPPEPLAEAV